MRSSEDTSTSAWCRHEIRRLLARRIAAQASITLVGVAAILSWRLDSVTIGVATGVAGAVVATALRLGRTMLAGSIGVRYLHRYLAAPPATLVGGPFEPADATDVAEHRARHDAELIALGYDPFATAHVGSAAGPAMDLWIGPGATVVAIDRSSGTVVAMNALAGEGVLMSSALFTPPSDHLVVNTVPGGDVVDLVTSHRRLARDAFSSRIRTLDPVATLALCRRREHEAYRELGPHWGVLLDLRCRPHRGRMSVSPDVGDVLLSSGFRSLRALEPTAGGRSTHLELAER